MSSNEIMDALDFDCRDNAHWGVFIQDLPQEYQDNNDLKIFTPEYIEWLEEKLTELQKTNPTLF